jgi:signal transduction histidine kinase
VKEDKEVLLSNAAKRLSLFAIAFSAFGFCIETWLHIINHNISLIFIEGTTALLSIVLTALLVFNKINEKIATGLLVYSIVVNTTITYTLAINEVDIGSMVLRDMLYSLLLVFLAAHVLNRKHNILISVLFTTLFATVAIVTKSNFLFANLPIILLLFIGGCITVNAFAQLLNVTVQKYFYSQEKVKELNKYKHNLINLIIHDLKVPINSIIDLSSTKENTIQQKINNTASELNNQIMTILDVDQLEKAEVALNTNIIEIKQLLSKAVNSVEVLSLNRNISININYKTNGYIKCDNDQVHRVLINLLSNAIKHSLANSVVNIEVESRNEGCILTIIDHGEGIKPEHLSRIFDKFFYVQTANLSNKTSNGLGLAFCKLAMQAHNGNIKVESEYGKGAKFKLFFPDYIESEIKAHSTNSSLEKLQLRDPEKESLSQIIFQLNSIAIYKISEIVEVLTPLQKSNNKNIRHWSEYMLQAAYSSDYDNYNYYLHMVGSTGLLKEKLLEDSTVLY